MSVPMAALPGAAFHVHGDRFARGRPAIYPLSYAAGMIKPLNRFHTIQGLQMWGGS